MEISNKTIVALLAVALVITIVGTGISISKLNGLNSYSALSGAAISGAGTTSVQVNAVASINLFNTSLNFGTGYYNSSCTSDYSEVFSNGTAHRCWVNATGGSAFYNTSGSTSLSSNQIVVIENNGTAVLNVSLDTNYSNAEEFLCAGASCASTTTAAVSFYGQQNDSSSCDTVGGTFYTNPFTILDYTSETKKDLCTKLNWQDSQDSINVSWAFIIPNDAGSGTKQIEITYTGVAN